MADLNRSATNSLSTLHRLIAQHYNLNELQVLSFDLNVDWDELGGETKSAKARELILHLSRQGRLNELATAVQAARPGVDWPDVSRLSPEESTPWAIAPFMEEDLLGPWIQVRRLMFTRVLMGEMIAIALMMLSLWISYHFVSSTASSDQVFLYALYCAIILGAACYSPLHLMRERIQPQIAAMGGATLLIAVWLLSHL